MDDSGAPVTDALWHARQAALESELASFAPDALLIEMFPFGRRQFRRELIPLLETAAERRPRPLVACSVRDILVQKNKADRLQEMLDLLERHYDLVLVHGDPAFADFALTFPAASAIAGKIRYTGFVVGDLPARVPPSARQDVVLVSAGGGAVGAPLLNAALAARPLTQQRDALWHFITGPNLAQTDFTALAEGRRRKTAHRAISSRFSAASSVLPRLGLASRLQHADGNSRRRRAGRRGAVRRRAGERAAPAGAAAGGARPGAGSGARGSDAGTVGGSDRCGSGDAGAARRHLQSQRAPQPRRRSCIRPCGNGAPHECLARPGDRAGALVASRPRRNAVVARRRCGDGDA